jgi:murein tripeptide amidase MpaA
MISQRKQKWVGLITAATLAASVAAALATGPVAAAPAEDDTLVLTVAPGRLSDSALADLLAGADVIGAQDGQYTLLADGVTALTLTVAGARIVESVTYGEYIADAVPVATHRTLAAARDYPVPSRLGEKEYETYYGGYRTIAAHEEFLADVAAAYPELAELVDFGNSWKKVQNPAEGHDLMALRLTAGADTDGDWEDHANAKPRFFLYSQAHAREVIASELAWRFIDYLVSGYGSDPELTELLDTTEVWVVPNGNPDAVELVEEGLSAADLRYIAAGDANPVNTSKAWQRKNLNDSDYVQTSQNWSSSQPGIDLNRNFATAWGGASTSSTPSSLTYKGTAPFSEPEARYEAELLEDLWGAFKVGTTTPAPDTRQGVYVNIHSAAGLVVQPYAYDYQANIPNQSAINALGFRQAYLNGYQTGKAGEILYNNAGNDIDWIYDELGVPAYTWELGSSAQGGFFPNYARVPGFWAEQSGALVYAAKAAAAPYTSAEGPSILNWKVAHDGAGNIAVTGTASDDTFGNVPSDAARRPAAQEIADVQVVVGELADPLVGPVGIAFQSDRTTAAFNGPVPVSDAVAGARQKVHVRAQDEAGFWGPWYTTFLAAAAGTPGVGFENIQLTVQPGVLSLEVPLANWVELTPITATGEDQTTTGALVPVTVTNGRGTAAGWSLTGQATNFVGDNNSTLSGANLGWAPTAEVVAGSDTPPSGQPASTVNAGGTVAPLANNQGLTRSRTLASSPTNQSAGRFTAAGTLTLGVPGSTKAGHYSSILTLTLQ